MTNRVYDFTLAAVLGATQRFDVSGSQVKVLAAPGGSIGVKLDTGPEITLLEGQGIKLEGVQFRDVTIRNLQAVANVGTLFIGDSSFVDDRVTGVVSVVDGGKARTLAGQAICARDSAVAAAGQVPVVQLWNAAGSGQRIIIKSLVVSAGVAGDIFIGFAAGQETPAAQMRQKLSPGAVTTASRIQVGDAATIAAALTSLWQQPAQVNVATSIKFDEPVVLLEGAGLAVAQNTVAATISVTFEAVQEPITS